MRFSHIVSRSVETGLPCAYLNLVGAQDDQVFDGASFVINPGGQLTHHMTAFEETLDVVTFTETEEGWRAEPGDLSPQPADRGADYHAIVLALRDYLAKAGFQMHLPADTISSVERFESVRALQIPSCSNRLTSNATQIARSFDLGLVGNDPQRVSQ